MCQAIFARIGAGAHLRDEARARVGDLASVHTTADGHVSVLSQRWSAERA